MKMYLILCVICILQRVVQIESVVGGEFATDGQFPYLVSIQTLERGRGRHYAGGVIVSTRFVLSTAVHIKYYASTPSDIFIVFGSIYIHDITNNSTVMGIERISVHPSYDVRYMKSDIAVLRTSKAFVFTEFVNLVGLPTLDLPVEGGTKANVTGWNVDLLLRFSTTKTISTTNCKRLLQGLTGNKQISDMNVCTMNPVGIGICNGDYGSPLVDEKQIVIGLASWTAVARDCANGHPDVYTRVQPYVEWIDSVMNSGPLNAINMIPTPALIILQIFVIFVNLN